MDIKNYTNCTQCMNFCSVENLRCSNGKKFYEELKKQEENKENHEDISSKE